MRTQSKASLIMGLFGFTIWFLIQTSHAQDFSTQALEGAHPLAHPQIQKELLIVGSEQEYPPFATGMTDNEAGGFTVELWKAVAAEAGLKYTIRVRPFREILRDFQEERVDVLINLAQSKQRHQFADFTVPHVIVSGAVFVRKGETSIRTEDDLAKKSIIVLNADLAHDYALAKGWGAQLVLVDTTAEGFQLLASGKHDAVLIGKLPGMQTINALGLSDIEVLKFKAGFAQKFGFAVHEGHSELLGRINEALSIMKETGVYAALYEKWFGMHEVREVGLEDVLKFVIPIALFFLIVGGYFYYRRELERKQALKGKLEHERRYKVFIHTSMEGYWVTDEQGNLLEVNDAYCKLSGYSNEELLNMNVADLEAKEGADAVAKHIKEIKDKGAARFESKHRCKDGGIIDVEISSTMVLIGGLQRGVVFIHDLTKRKEVEAKLKRAATLDGLTNIYNRTHFNNMLEQEVSRAIRYETPLSLLMLDIDHFKNINDTHGHQTGDACLVALANLMKGLSRSMDTCARYGGEEFVILLPQTVSKNAIIFGERLRKKVEEMVVQHGDHTVQFTVSVGITTLSLIEKDTADIMIKKVDSFLYKAKGRGRNCVVSL